MQSGLSVLGEIPWGSHLCQFYDTASDLLEIVIPYFEAGLETNQACLWVTDVFSTERAADALRAAVPDLDARLDAGQMGIIESRAWYQRGGRFDADAVLADWMATEKAALARGYAGARVSGGAIWLKNRVEFESFAEYEERLNDLLKDHRIVCLCNYALRKSEAVDVLDVVHSHGSAVARRRGDWQVVEAASLKTAKEVLRRANENLETKVAQRTAQCERLLDSERQSRHAAQKAVRLRDEFLTIASHELRTPLHSLQLAVQGLSSGAVAVTPEALARAVSLVERQARRLVRLVAELLDVAHIQVGRLDLHRETVDLVEVVRRMIDEFGDELARAECPVSVHVPDAPVVGEWDRLRLEQIVTNLLSNAAKFARGKPIEITVDAFEGRARLVVADHGMGIPPERLPHVFERFERAVSARQYGGLGLGLYVVRTIVEAMGGTVRAESTLGAGSTLIVDLPCAPPEKT